MSNKFTIETHHRYCGKVWDMNMEVVLPGTQTPYVTVNLESKLENLADSKVEVVLSRQEAVLLSAALELAVKALP
jgi:hypothetical protein